MITSRLLQAGGDDPALDARVDGAGGERSGVAPHGPLEPGGRLVELGRSF